MGATLQDNRQAVVSGTDLLVLNCINKCWNTLIDVETLASILAGAAPADGWQNHLTMFFLELPLEAVAQFSAEHGINKSELKRSYNSLMPTFRAGNPRMEAWLNG